MRSSKWLIFCTSVKGSRNSLTSKDLAHLKTHCYLFNHHFGYLWNLEWMETLVPILRHTFPEANIAPENRPKETRIPTIHFQGREMLVSRSVAFSGIYFFQISKPGWVGGLKLFSDFLNLGVFQAVDRETTHHTAVYDRLYQQYPFHRHVTYSMHLPLWQPLPCCKGVMTMKSTCMRIPAIWYKAGAKDQRSLLVRLMAPERMLLMLTKPPPNLHTRCRHLSEPTKAEYEAKISMVKKGGICFPKKKTWEWCFGSDDVPLPAGQYSQVPC